MKRLFLALLAVTVLAVPALAQDVKVSVFSSFESSYRGFSAKIVTPVIDGLKDKQAERAINDRLLERSLALITKYQQDVSSMLKKNPDEDGHMGVESNFVIKADNKRSLAFDVYLFNAAGSSSTVHDIYVIDKKNGRPITLRGLFKEGADYVSIISSYIKGEMERRNAKENGMFWVNTKEMTPFEAIKPDQSFYLNDKGALVICFDKYEVAAGAQGSPEFEIPAKVVKSILAK